MYGFILPWARYVLRLKHAARFTYKYILNNLPFKHKDKIKFMQVIKLKISICLYDLQFNCSDAKLY